jgi:hypothetical protein
MHITTFISHQMGQAVHIKSLRKFHSTISYIGTVHHGLHALLVGTLHHNAKAAHKRKGAGDRSERLLDRGSCNAGQVDVKHAEAAVAVSASDAATAAGPGSAW